MTNRILAALRNGPIDIDALPVRARLFVDQDKKLAACLSAHHGELWRVERGVVFPLSEIWR